MIKVKIGPVQKELEDVDPNWVHKMIRSLREAGQPVCVIVTIDEPPLNFTLSTKECNRRGSPPRGSISCRSNARFPSVSTQLADPGFRCCHLTAELLVLG
jgi:hypothetical protein